MLKFAQWVVRLRWLVIVAFAALTCFFALQLSKAELDTEMKNQLPADLETRISLKKIEELFGATDMAMLVVSADDVTQPANLTQLKSLSEAASALSGCERVVSPHTAKDIASEGGEMIVRPAIAPEGEARTPASIRAALEKNPLVMGNLVSRDFRNAVIICFVSPKVKDTTLIEQLGEVAEANSGPGEVLLGGMPLTRVSLAQDMRADMRRFLPVGLALMLAFLLVCFRQARGVLLPFLVTVIAIICSMGLVPLLGWKIHTVTILLPVILLAVANDYGIHLLSRYQEDNLPGSDASSCDLAQRGLVELGRPVVATGITTMVGLLCLLSHMIIPAQQLGVLGAFGVAVAMLGSLLLIPAILAVLPRAKPLRSAAQQGAQSRGIERMLLWFAAMIPRRPKVILWASLVVSLGVGAGALRVVVDTNPMSFYERSEPIWRSTHLLNEHLGGWAGISVLAHGDIKDPKVLLEIDAMERHLSRHAHVGTTNSIASVLRKMNQVMHDGDPAYDRIPESRELVAQYLLLYSMSGDEEDFSKLVDFDYKNAQIMAKITDSGTSAATRVLDYTHAYMQKERDSSIVDVGGLVDVMADMVHHIVWGQIGSLAWASVLVWLLVALLLRSAIGGVLAVAPLLLALLMIFGVMGLFGIELNLITALLSSIMIGVGVDYAIHFLWRFRDERRLGLAPEQAVFRTLLTTGRGIIFNGLSVVLGFAVLIISAFYPVRFFGLLVALSILASLAAALLIVPALVLLLRPTFLEPNQNSSR